MTQTVVNVPESGGSAFDPTDITIADNPSGPFVVKEGYTDFIRNNTTNGSEKIDFDNDH